VELSKGIQTFLQTSRVARMATVDADGCPHIVPICYAYDGSRLYSAVDKKPKRVEANLLRRLVNIRANPRICVIIDEYDEDWSRLRFIVIHGIAAIEPAGTEHRRAVHLLRKKYPQYQAMNLAEGVNPVIAITPTKVVSWGTFE
jgi:PPOX class probable F420-dependent enzyme